MTWAKWIPVALTAAAALGGCYQQQLDKPRRYACSPDGGAEQCFGGWVCKGDGFCHDPASGEALACATNADCTGGWHCGVSGVCYDLADAGAVECRLPQDVDGGSDPGDCAPGWRCGLERTCHDADAGASYQCGEDDSFCAPGWRCGVNGTCAELAREALRTAIDPAKLTVTQVSPRLGPNPQAWVGQSEGGQSPWVVAIDGKYWGTIVNNPGINQTIDTFPLSASDVIDASGFSGDLYVLSKSGITHVDSNQRTESALGNPLPSATHLVAHGSGFSPYVVAWEPNAYTVMDKDGNVLGPPAPPPDAGTGTTLQSFELAGASFSDPLDSTNPYEYLFALTNRGVYLVPRLNSTFVHSDGTYQTSTPTLIPIVLPGLQSVACANAGAAVQAMRVSTGPSNYLWIGVQVDVGGQPNVGTFYVDGNASNFPVGIQCVSFTPDLPLQPACKPGEQLVDFQLYGDNFSFGGRYLRTLCRGKSPQDGSIHDHVYEPLFAIGLGSICDDCFGASPVTPIGPGKYRGFSTSEGLLYDCGAFGQFPTQRCNPIQAQGELPDVLAGTVGGEFRAAALYDGAIDTSGAGFRSSPLGFVRDFGVINGRVQNRPGWTVAALSQQGSNPSSYGILEALPDGGAVPVATIDPPYGDSRVFDATLVRARNGTEQVLVAHNDTLWAGTVDEQAAMAPDAGLSRLRVRFVPSPGLPIDSLAATSVPEGAPADGGSLIDGYVISSERVFLMSAETVSKWRATELQLGDETPLKVWADGDRARVGLQSGVVLSLPSRIPLSQPLPGVIGFEQLCGDSYALTATDVWLLQAPTGSAKLGGWVKVAGTAATMGQPWGRMFSDDRELVIFSASGRAISLEPEGGCPSK